MKFIEITLYASVTRRHSHNIEVVAPALLS